jgi:predicted aspartyl protease
MTSQGFRQRFNFACYLVVCVATITACPVDVVSAEDGTERVPIEASDTIFIPVEVFGEKHLFVLDTGFTSTAFDKTFRERLGIASKLKQVKTANCNFELFPSPMMRVGAISRQDFQSTDDVACLDLADVRSASSQDIMGIIGMDYLESRILKIDPDEGMVTFPNEVTLKDAHTEPLRLGNGRRPRVLVWISDMGLQPVLLDTGFTRSVSLEKKLFSELVNRKRIVLREDYDFAVAGDTCGTITKRTGVLDLIALGPYQFGNVTVVEDEEVNLIGMSFLERFQTELDFPNRQAYFRPSSRLNQPERSGYSGLSVERIKEKLLVRSIVPGSVAEKADVREGDRILDINGTSGTQLTMAKVRAFRRGAATELKLTLEREGEVRTATLQFTPRPDPFPQPEPFPLLKQAPEAISVLTQ